MANDEPVKIDLTPRTATRHVPSLGVCTVRAPTRSVERALSRYYRAPLRGDTREYVNRLLVGCLQLELDIEQVDALSPVARGRLRAAVAEAADVGGQYKRLAGSHLSGDERLFAVMYWRDRRLAQDVHEVLRSITGRVNREAQSIARSYGPQRTVRLAAVERAAASSFNQQRRRALASSLPRAAGLASGHLTRQMKSLALPRETASTRTVATQAANRLPTGFGLVRAREYGLASRLPADRLRSPLAQIVKAASARSFLGPRILAELRSNLVARQRVQASAVAQLGSAARLGGLIETAKLASAGRAFTRGLRLPPELQEQAAEAKQFMRRWKGHPLWFILKLLTLRESRHLADLTQEETEQLVLDALERVVTGGQFVPALQQAVQHAPYLSPSRRRKLVHGLEHAERAEWIDGHSQLLSGVEGAFWAAARGNKVITVDRYFVSRPGKLARGVEMVFKHLPFERAYVTFLQRRVFGTSGNPFRHGDVDGGEREHVLLCIAALVGWLDAFADQPASQAFGAELRSNLPLALEAPAAWAAPLLGQEPRPESEVLPEFWGRPVHTGIEAARHAVVDTGVEVPPVGAAFAHRRRYVLPVEKGEGDGHAGKLERS